MLSAGTLNSAIRAYAISTKFNLVKAGPTIGLAAGIAGFTATTVIASRQTLKAPKVMDEHKELMANLAGAKAFIEGASDIDMQAFDQTATDEQKKFYTAIKTEKGYKAAKFGCYMQTAFKFAKLYAPAIAMGLASSAVLVFAHKSLSGRLDAALGAAAAIGGAYKKYRENIVAEFGEEADKRAVTTVRDEEGNIISFVGDNGEEIAVKNDIPEPTIKDESATFDRVYGPNSTRLWSSNKYDNLRNLSSIQNECNDILKSRGHLFLNEVYTMLGFSTIPAGQMVGWMLTGDEGSANYVDFGVFDTYDYEERMAGVPSDWYYLRFNHDGVIYDQI